MEQHTIGLIAYNGERPFHDLVVLAQALQSQFFVLKKHWPDIDNFAVKAFRSFDDYEAGAWPIVIANGVANGGGFHVFPNGKPGAMVDAGNMWDVLASHECFEMMVDPGGRLTRRGPPPSLASVSSDEVEYLVEICDPCVMSFPDGGSAVRIPDFVTPSFYKGDGGPFSARGSVKAPATVLTGGYLTYRDIGTDEWFQLVDDGAGSASQVALGSIDMMQLPARLFIDRNHTPEVTASHLAIAAQKKPKRLRSAGRPNPYLRQAVERRLGEIVERVGDAGA